MVAAAPILRETGKATWYKRSRHTHTTASGEALDDRLFTAAHRTLPLGSYVRVTDTASGRDIIVRVNDRGPFTAGFIIDLSKAAAETLGVLRDHKMVVALEPVPPPATADHPARLVSTLPTGKAALAALTPAKAKPGAKPTAGKPIPVKAAATKVKAPASKPAPTKAPAGKPNAPKPAKPAPTKSAAKAP